MQGTIEKNKNISDAIEVLEAFRALSKEEQQMALGIIEGMKLQKQIQEHNEESA